MKSSYLKGFINLNSLLVGAALVATLYLIITGAYIQEGENINIGDVANRTYIATRQVENRLATERLREAAADSVTPTYVKLSEVDERIMGRIDEFFSELAELRKANIPIFVPSGAEGEEYPLSEGDAVPVSGSGNGEEEESVDLPTPEPAPMIIRSEILSEITQEQFDFLLNMSTADYNAFEENTYAVIENVLATGVRDDNVELARVLVEIRSQFERIYTDPQHSQLAYDIISLYLEPNRVVDEETTERLKQEKMAEVEPVYFLRNQNVVIKGAIITEEIYYVLDDLGLVSKGYVENMLPILGTVVIVLSIFGFLLYYIFLYKKQLYGSRKEVLLLFTLYMVVILITRLLSGLPYMFVPVLAFTMLMGMLLDYRLAIVANIAMTMVTMLIYKGEIDFLLYFSIVGTIMALAAKYANQRNKIFVVSLVVSLLSGAVSGSIGLLIERELTTDIITTVLYAFLDGFFTVIVCMGSLPFWEAVFGVITPVKLLDLVNPNNELLRRLAIEAPGTYHHSLIVANLAETAAYDIGGDSNIARVGGYYHDIGKLKYPQYFSENQVGENPHDHMDPYSSVEVITSHVKIGLEMAESSRLPAVIKDIIAQHHGNTLVKYFYHKAKKADETAEIKEGDFRYPHTAPLSKEAAVVMLADTVEAAVRSMISNSKTMEEVEQFVRVLIKDKLDDGQLLNSGFTIKDLDTVALSFMRVFKGMYHERIPYPKEAVTTTGAIAQEKSGDDGERIQSDAPLAEPEGE